MELLPAFIVDLYGRIYYDNGLILDSFFERRRKTMAVHLHAMISSLFAWEEDGQFLKENFIKGILYFGVSFNSNLQNRYVLYLQTEREAEKVIGPFLGKSWGEAFDELGQALAGEDGKEYLHDARNYSFGNFQIWSFAVVITFIQTSSEQDELTCRFEIEAMACDRIPYRFGIIGPDEEFTEEAIIGAIDDLFLVLEYREMLPDGLWH